MRMRRVRLSDSCSSAASSRSRERVQRDFALARQRRRRRKVRRGGRRHRWRTAATAATAAAALRERGVRQRALEILVRQPQLLETVCKTSDRLERRYARATSAPFEKLDNVELLVLALFLLLLDHELGHRLHLPQRRRALWWHTRKASARHCRVSFDKRERTRAELAA